MHAVRASEGLPESVASAIIDLLERPLGPGDGHTIGNARRERELCRLFATFDRVRAFQVKRRLEIDHAGDPLARAFARLVVERRERVRRYLADVCIGRIRAA